MKEVQVTCPQCHNEYAELVYEPEDFTDPRGWLYVVKQCCPCCGWPDFIYDTTHMKITRNTVTITWDKNYILTKQEWKYV